MNKSENVPIATLSGIASLSEVIGELPMPSSSTAAKDGSVILNDQVAQEAGSLIKQPADMVRLQSLQATLAQVNTAYLDFKNSSHNRPCYYPDPSQLPAVMQQLMASKADLFYPQFDAYHGSPLKTSMASVYSPSHRNTFLLHQQQMAQFSQFSQSSSASPLKSPLMSMPPPMDGRQLTPLKGQLRSPLKSSQNIQNTLMSPMKQEFPPLVKVGASPLQSLVPPPIQQSEVSSSQPELEDMPTLEAADPNAVMTRRGQHLEYQSPPKLVTPPKSRKDRRSAASQDIVKQEADICVPDSKLSDPADVRKKLTDLQTFQSDMVAKAADVYVNEVTDAMTYIERDYSQQHEVSGSQDPQAHNVNNDGDKKPISIRLPLKNIVLDESPSKKHKKKKSRKKKRSRDNELVDDDVLTAESSATPIPKLIVRKVKKTEGEQEIEKLEVISPVKNQTAHVASEVSSSQCHQEQLVYSNLQVDNKVPTQSMSFSNQQTHPHTPSKKQQDALPGDVLASPQTKMIDVKVKVTDIQQKALLHSTVPSVHVEEVVSQGEIPMAEDDLSSVPKRGRPKKKTFALAPELLSAPEDDLGQNRKRGRSKRRTLESATEESVVSDGESLSTVSKKRSRRSSATSVTTSLSEGSASDWHDEDGTEVERMGKRKSEKPANKRFKHDDYTNEEGVEVKTDVKRFMFLLDKILDHEMELEADGNLDFNEDDEIPPEALMPRPLISSLSVEVAKMKSSRALQEVPADQLVRIISVMDRHVRDTINLQLNSEDDEEAGSQGWHKLQTERILRSAEAGYILLCITTAPDMPKQVYLEEAIDHTVMLCQFHLENTVYPEFDPVYRANSDNSSEVYMAKTKRGRTASTKSKTINQIYNKFCEVVSLVGDLVGMESLTDSTILKISQIGVTPFFVEHVNILQLEALKLARTVFRNYIKHRDLILDDILASLARLPTSKRNLRNYRLHNNSCIQMFTALVLQLVQCTVQIPEYVVQPESQSEALVDKDVLIVKSYEDALRAAQNFMTVFLKKCSTTSRDESDFRPMFENFLQDLLITVNLPEWPSAEVLLTQMGRLFVVTFSNTKMEASLRSLSLDYLAQIAAHVRKDALKIRDEGHKDQLQKIVSKLLNTNSSATSRRRKNSDEENDNIPIVEDMEVYEEKFRKSLLTFLTASGKGDSSFKFSREFYLGQWIRDVQIEIEKSMIAPMLSIPGAALAEKSGEDEEKVNQEVSAEKLQSLQEKKGFYHTLIGDKAVSTLRSSQLLTYNESLIVASHLASSRAFSQSFDLYMQQIFRMLNEQAIGLRTKAVKALTMIVSIDATILARADVQASVHARFRDPSTNVREAAVDLIGQFILKCPELTNQYYDMIMERILDTGVSVRKRVIKILRDICIEQPDYDKIPEICSKIIRRVNDEAGIKKLVTEVFRTMWFEPAVGKARSADDLYQRAFNITRVVSLSRENGYDWLESLLENLFDAENASLRNTALSASQKIVDCLFEKLLKSEETKSDPNILVSCLTTLYMFCKSHPRLLVAHATALQPYLSAKVSSQSDALIIQNVSKILELVVPLLDHPNPKFLAVLEEDAMKLILTQSQLVVHCCSSCLAAVVNNVTYNYKFVLDSFNKFLAFLKRAKAEHIKNPSSKVGRPTLLRSLFTIGLFCRHFDLDSHLKEQGEEEISETVFELCLYFTDHADEEISLKAIQAVGFIGVRYHDFLLRQDCKQLYQNILSPHSKSTKAKCAIFKNLQNHLIEEEERLQSAEKTDVGKRKKKNAEVKQKNIKEFGDSMSGTTSAVMQSLLKDIMQGFLHPEMTVRMSAFQVIAIILRQGLIHPAQCIPYLVAISTDNSQVCRVGAENCLEDIDSRYQGFIHMKALHGIKMSYEIQKLIQNNAGKYLCGYRQTENKVAFINHVYGMVRSNKQYRRPLLMSLIKIFDDKRATIDMLYYLTENLAYLNYQTPEEPLFIIHHVNTTVSLAGASVLQSFKEVIHGIEKAEAEESDDDDDEEVLKAHTYGEEAMRKTIKSSYGCMLLLELKKYLKLVFNFSDKKCQKYSPSEPSKLYDKALTRKTEQDFTSEYLHLFFDDNQLTHQVMMDYYLKFKMMMMKLDTEEDSDADSPPEKPPTSRVRSAVKKESNDSDDDEEDYSPSRGVIPPSIDVNSLPELTINLPSRKSNPRRSSAGRKSRGGGSRRSSRSSRCSGFEDD